MASNARIYDVVVIGAGIAGAAVARELSRYRLSVAIVEEKADVCFGVSKGSHAFVHCGIPVKGCPLRSWGERQGNQIMPQLCKELEVPYRKIGKLLVAVDDSEIDALKDLKKTLCDNGVPGVELILDRDELHRMEPRLSDHVVGALHTPTTGVTTPWGLVYGLVENAVENGVRLFLDSPVVSIRQRDETTIAIDAGSRTLFSRFAVNAAGPDAARVAGMVKDPDVSLSFLKMQRVIMDRECGFLARHLIRGLDQGAPVGDFVSPTVDGNLIVGSSVELVEDARDDATTVQGIEQWVLASGRKLIPGLPPEKVIHPFSGTIPMAEGGDFILRAAPSLPRLVHFVLGASGLTAAVPMARKLVSEILPQQGLDLEEKSDYVPTRKNIPCFWDMDDESRAEQIARHPDYGRVICRCEQVTEGQIVEAINRGASTRDGVKFRTRAGMGRCQSNFCGHKVMDIMSRELKQPAGSLTRKGENSFELRPPKGTDRKCS